MSPVESARAALERLRTELSTAQADATAAESAFAESESDASWQRVAKTRDVRDRLALRVTNAEQKVAAAENVEREKELAEKRVAFAKALERVSEDEFNDLVKPMRAEIGKAVATILRTADLIAGASKARASAIEQARALGREIGEKILPVSVADCDKQAIEIVWAAGQAAFSPAALAMKELSGLYRAKCFEGIVPAWEHFHTHEPAHSIGYGDHKPQTREIDDRIKLVPKQIGNRTWLVPADDTPAPPPEQQRKVTWHGPTRFDAPAPPDLSDEDLEEAVG